MPHHGHKDFVVCFGYKGNMIGDYLVHSEIRNRDFTVTLGSRRVETRIGHSEAGWRITLAETGNETNTGGRIRRVALYQS